MVSFAAKKLKFEILIIVVKHHVCKLNPNQTLAQRDRHSS